MRSLLLIGAAAAILMGCGGPTELSNADVEAQRKEFSKENFDKSKGGNTEPQDQADVERGGDRSH